ncbi:Myc-type, basic helix-loop-helix domain-containing protein, partial [Zopfochytrium polystomum]
KELLTEEEKRTNHILSEQRRRNVIRNGFQTLAELVPSLGVGTGMGKSKSVILTRTAEYIRTIEEQNRRLQETLSGLEVRVEEKRRAMYA